MLTIRFARIGKKNRAQFQIVLQEHTIAPGGRHVEILGSHDPHLKKTVLKEERIKYWVGQGVQISDTAFNLLLAKGLVSGEKRKVKMPARNASSSENIVENSGNGAASIESTNSEQHNEAGGPAKKVEEVKVEEAAPVAAEETAAPAEEAKADSTDSTSSQQASSPQAE